MTITIAMQPVPGDVLLVIEVVRQFPGHYDRDVKLPRYAAAGIPEVWIANVPARQVEAFHDPVDGVYQSSRIVPADGKTQPPGLP